MDWHHSQSIIKLCLEELKVNTCCPEFMTTLHLVINNGNWTNWSAMWYEIIRLISKSVQFGLKSQVWFQTKIAWHEVQLPLYYSHFETQNSVSTNTLLVKWAVCWKAETKRLLHLILYSKQKWHNIEQKWCNLRQKLSDLEHEWHDLE